MTEENQTNHSNNGQIITEDEAQLYDRQIRLWGLDAQKRLRASSVLLIGLRGLGAEICKNVVLSGVKTITLLDDEPVTAEDFTGQFLIPREDVGKNRAVASLSRAQQLNPMVDIKAETEHVTQKSEDFFDGFDLVVATNCSKSVLINLNEICRRRNISFFAGDVFGYYGYMFTDLGHHKYVEEKLKQDEPDITDADGDPVAKKAKIEQKETVMVQKVCEFCPLKHALLCDWIKEAGEKTLKYSPKMYFILQVLFNFLEKNNRHPSSLDSNKDMQELQELREQFLQDKSLPNHMIPQEFECYCFAQLSPVCAIVGGIIGQEIVKALSGRDAPLKNFFFYNGADGSALVDFFGKV